MKLHGIYILSAMALMAGCNDWEPLPPPRPVPAERVFLMYDNINNSGGKPFTGNVNAAGRAIAEGVLDPAERVVVYERMSGGDIIYELYKDPSVANGFSKKIRKQYAEGENAGLDAATMGSIVGDVRALFPADARWGFAFGSHGKGWIPKGMPDDMVLRKGGSPGASEHPFAELWAEWDSSLTRFFQGYGKLDVAEFVDALDDWEWDFIILDDCFMASVEALYDMRTLAGHIIASPTEIMMEGFPYDLVAKTIFADDDWSDADGADVVGVGREFVEYYRSKLDGIRSATVAVVKMDEMEALAEAIRQLELRPDMLASVEGIQYYEGYMVPGHVFFDLDDYLTQVIKGSDPEGYAAFKEQFDRTVVFADHTDSFYSNLRYFKGYIDVDHYSGINVFIPWRGTASLLPYYEQTEWYKAVYAAE